MTRLNKFEEAALADTDVRFGFEAFDVLQEIGRLTKEARLEAHLSQEDLQRVSGIDQADISRVESGAMELGPTVLTLVRLAHATGRRLVIGLTAPEGEEDKAPRIISL